MSTPSPEDSPWRNPLLLIGGFGALLSILLGMLAPHDGALWRVPQVLNQRVAVALAAQNYPGLDIRMDGQRAVLAGFVEREEDIVAVRRAALTASGAGGAWAGGITSVDISGIEIGAMERPFAWSVSRQGERVVLSGAVPSARVHSALMDAAAQAFPALERVDEMRVAGGAPSPDFGAVAREAVRRLAELNSGEVRIVDTQIAVIGDGGQAGVDAMRASLGAPPAPFRTRIAVTVDGLDVEHPELQGLNLAEGDAETCERAFERLMERNVITFTPGSAAIAPQSRDVLNALASVALRCDRFGIEVAGHTDNNGGRELNMQLSQARADAVAAYLAGQGVARSRLAARGYGPDRPRASNASEQGQAANRRIEFYVSS